MRVLLFVFLSIQYYYSIGQKIYFLPDNFSSENKYAESINKLGKELIPRYEQSNKAEYFNGLFRFYFATEDHPAVIESLDSFDIHSKMDKIYYKVSGFHYRIHSMTMVSLQNDPSKEYDREYADHFKKVYSLLPEAGKEQVKAIYEKADTEKEKSAFIDLANQYQNAGKDSISIENAVELVKQWNYWQVYSKTVRLAKKQIAAFDIIENTRKQNNLLGFEDGATLSPDKKTYIQNVTLVDVENQKLVQNATVGITGLMITSISTKTKTTIPSDATVIDGTGKFLIPGLTDAHIHFFQSGGLYTRPDAIDLRKHMPYEKEIEWTHRNMNDALKRYIRTGITSVIDVGATRNFLQLRDKFKGKSYAPAIYMTGPLLTSYEPAAFKNLGNDEPFNLVTNEEEGRKMVQDQLPYKPDFIKIWYIALGNNKEEAARKFLPTARAIIDEAHKNNLKVAVHATERITAQLAIEAGCDFLVHSVEDEIISDELLKLMKLKNIILCPTLVVHDGYNKTFGQELDFTASELRQANPKQLGTLYDLKHLPDNLLINSYKNAIKNNKASNAKEDSICLVNLKKMIDAGIRIAAGTDAGNIGTMHAASYIAELKAMKKAGISNWQVLQTATINPSFILGNDKETGSISLGKKADMVLLNANPVDQLENLEKVNLVFNKGHIISPDTLIKETPLALVQRQLNAYNDRDLEAFLEPYADDVELYEFPSKLVTKGKEQMRKDYAFFKTVTNLHCEIKERIIQGNTIIDKESVTGFGNKPVEATAIYQVENNKIKRVYFISNQ